jgi:YidC/Oxa1 family membrane protein insertase
MIANQPSHNTPVLQSPHAGGQYITVKTDLLDLVINTQGGTIEQASLLQYPQDLKTPQNKVKLFNNDAANYYVAEGGIIGNQGSSPDSQQVRAIYQTSQTEYLLKSDQKQLTVKLTWQNKGITVTKNFVLTRGSYVIDVNYQVQNLSKQPWTGFIYNQLSRKEVQEHGSFLTHYATFTGAAISTQQEQYQKIKFKNFISDPINLTAQGGWVAMIQQYFLSAWVPLSTQTDRFYTNVNNDIYTVGTITDAVTAQSGQTINSGAKLYVGPAIASSLNALSPHLSMTIDYGWLFFISQIIFWLMKQIYNFIGNWGWAIIIVTVIIKIMFYPLSNKSFYSMAQMRKLQPKIAQLKERFGDDRQAMSKAMMELYRKEKVNPLSGCLPILIQIPVFIALYWVIMQTVELRQAPWMFWVHDLTIHDPYYILPVIMGVLMFFQQKMNPPPPDPTQAKVMMFMPVIFTVFFLGFPSGLVLYWITNTLVTILHQYYIIRKVDAADKAKK